LIFRQKYSKGNRKRKLNRRLARRRCPARNMRLRSWIRVSENGRNNMRRS
jgi:hypothetical protein